MTKKLVVSELRPFASPTSLDLMRCEDEPIHIPGAIQAHGCLFELSSSLHILRISSNAGSLLGQSSHALLEKPVATALGAAAAAWLQHTLADLPDDTLRSQRHQLAGGATGTLIVHRYAERTILEWLPDTAHSVPAPDAMEQALSGGIARARAAADMNTALQCIADGVARATGIDRVMVYRFHPDWHGEVVAEAVQPDLVPYRGLHYPASDIPAQARQLFLATRARVIVDVYARDPILLDSEPLIGEPQLDLSLSVLRSVSPVHIQYLRNMGTGATLVTSLVADGQLWGLISCHHRSAYPFPWYAHDRMRQFTEQAAAVVAEHRERERQARQTRQAHSHAQATAALASSPDTAATHLLDLFDSKGLLLRSGSAVHHFGQIPDTAAALADAVLAQPQDIGATDCVGQHFAGAAPHAGASGLAWLVLSRARRQLLLFVRPEFAHTVNWGGDPNKPALPDPVSRRLSPRGSFELWQQTVSGRSRPWDDDAPGLLARLRDQSVAAELLQRTLGSA